MEIGTTFAGSSANEASTLSDESEKAVLHIVCDRDVGLFNLVMGAVAHIYWALKENRIPIIYYGKKNCYWTPNGYRDRNTVWEYYFEPVISEYPASRIPPYVLKWIADNPLKRGHLGHFVDNSAFISNNGAWHITVDGEVLRGHPNKAPSRKIREAASAIIRDYVRPRAYIVDKADRFFDKHLAGRYVIGVHIRGTDANVDPTRPVRQTRVNYDKFIAVLRRLLRKNPDALIFVASDEQASVDRIRNAFNKVIAYDSIRHQNGEVAGRGPAGGIMPGYLTQDPDGAAKNGEEAVIEYMLLSRCDYLVHNNSSIPRTVLSTAPGMPDTNIDEPSFLLRSGAVLRQWLPVWQDQAKINVVAKISDLPTLLESSSNPTSWDLIEGLSAEVVEESAAVAGQSILRLVAVGIDGRHALGMRGGGLVPRKAYRAVAWVKAEPGVCVMMEARDSIDPHTGNPSNYGVVQFDLAARSVVDSTGDILASGVDTAVDDWVKLWVDLRINDSQIFTLIGLLEEFTNRHVFSAADQRMIFGGFELFPR